MEKKKLYVLVKTLQMKNMFYMNLENLALSTNPDKQN